MRPVPHLPCGVLRRARRRSSVVAEVELALVSDPECVADDDVVDDRDLR